MGWPKGKKRLGHVNKDGSTHKGWGSLLAAREAVAKMTKIDKKRGRPAKGGEDAPKKWTTKLTNKGIEICPACQFPEAYAGYCNECGWMEPLIVNGKEWVPSAPRGRRA